jgi:signal transduction histidine kinase
MSELLSHSLGADIHYETVLAGGLWRAHVDRNQLESGILNLAVNARDAMAEAGRLTIETQNTHIDERLAAANYGVPAGQYVTIAVSDTGGGMSPEVIAKAFDPFFTTKAVGKGTGLGLSQVYGFVKQSGGHVKLFRTWQGHDDQTLPASFLGRDRHHSDKLSAVPPLGKAHEVILVVRTRPPCANLASMH